MIIWQSHKELGPQQRQGNIKGMRCLYMGKSIQSRVDSQEEGVPPLSARGIHVR